MSLKKNTQKRPRGRPCKYGKPLAVGKGNCPCKVGVRKPSGRCPTTRKKRYNSISSRNYVSAKSSQYFSAKSSGGTKKQR
jgi:hypothetical protein